MSNWRETEAGIRHPGRFYGAAPHENARDAGRAHTNSRLVATVPVIHYYPSSLSESPGPFSGDELARQHHPIRQTRSERATTKLLYARLDRMEAAIKAMKSKDDDFEDPFTPQELWNS